MGLISFLPMASLVSKDRLGVRMVLASPPWGRRERGGCVADASCVRVEVRFGVGGLVPAAGCGFRRACPWGGAVTNGWETDKRMEDSESLNPLIR